MWFVIIAAIVVLIILGILKFKKKIVINDDFITQIKFIQMYMNDTSEKNFFDKTEDEALELGRETMWDAAQDFNSRMNKAIIDKQPIVLGDVSLVKAAIKIIKAAEAMVHISKHGPIQSEIVAEKDISAVKSIDS